mmetsp:Transcript_1694/g.5943  ORF Transcript_1694/g.5943 Transcript_1694/m.5943 type:complete len:264 (+) Transcript_1694:1737-2528(+)
MRNCRSARTWVQSYCIVWLVSDEQEPLRQSTLCSPSCEISSDITRTPWIARILILSLIQSHHFVLTFIKLCWILRKPGKEWFRRRISTSLCTQRFWRDPSDWATTLMTPCQSFSGIDATQSTSRCSLDPTTSHSLLCAGIHPAYCRGLSHASESIFEESAGVISKGNREITPQCSIVHYPAIHTRFFYIHSSLPLIESSSKFLIFVERFFTHNELMYETDVVQFLFSQNVQEFVIKLVVVVFNSLALQQIITLHKSVQSELFL